MNMDTIMEQKKVQRVLMISSDRGMFDDVKSIRERIVEYGSLVSELHVIVFAEKKYKFEDVQISPNVWIYPTNSRSRWSYIRDAISIAAWLKENKNFVPDLITCQDPFETGWVGYKLWKKFGACLQIQIHTDFLSKEFRKRSLLNKVRVIMAKRTLSAASCIRVVSKRIQNSLVETKWNVTRNIVVLPILVDKERFAESGEIDAVSLELRRKYTQFGFIILVAGRFTKEKNIPLAIRVLKKISEKYGSVGMVIVGDGPEKERLQGLVKRLDLSGQVVFEPWTENVIPYYKAANAFLLTSSFEGYSMVIIEAALASCPVVATAVGVTDTYIQDGVNGFVCPVGDARCLSKKMARLITESNLGHVLASRSREQISESLHDKEEYLRLYQESWQTCCEVGKIKDIWEQ